MGTRVQVISDVVEVGVPILAGGPCRFRLGLGYSARGLGWTCQTTPSSREGSVSQTREREAVSTRGFGRFVLACFFSPHLRRLRELVWVGGCVTVPVAWASGPSALASRGPWGRRCRGTRDTARSRESGLVARRPGAGTCGVGLPPGAKSVHRLAKTASWSCFGPFVYTVAPLWTDVGTQECTQIGENGLLAPFWGIRVHCCAARIVRAAMRVATRTVSGGTSASTAMARRRRPLGDHLSLGRENRLYATGSARVAQPLA